MADPHVKVQQLLTLAMDPKATAHEAQNAALGARRILEENKLVLSVTSADEAAPAARKATPRKPRVRSETSLWAEGAQHRVATVAGDLVSQAASALVRDLLRPR